MSSTLLALSVLGYLLVIYPLSGETFQQHKACITSDNVAQDFDPLL